MLRARLTSSLNEKFCEPAAAFWTVPLAMPLTAQLRSTSVRVPDAGSNSGTGYRGAEVGQLQGDRGGVSERGGSEQEAGLKFGKQGRSEKPSPPVSTPTTRFAVRPPR